MQICIFKLAWTINISCAISKWSMKCVSTFVWFGLTLHIVSHFTNTSNPINCIILTGLNPSTLVSLCKVNIMQS